MIVSFAALFCGAFLQLLQLLHVLHGKNQYEEYEDDKVCNRQLQCYFVATGRP